MTKMVKNWQCGECGKIHTKKSDAEICENVHSDEKIAAITNDFNTKSELRHKYKQALKDASDLMHRINYEFSLKKLSEKHNVSKNTLLKYNPHKGAQK